MKVLVYVEGPSDRTAMETVLGPLISTARTRGVGIQFLPLGGKANILRDVPHKAVRYLSDKPDDWVFALPDLYPMKVYDGTPLAHRSFDDMAKLLRATFSERAERTGLDAAVYPHFRVHCFKHDLECLLLAAPEALAARLKTKDKIQKHWRRPVEDQNDNHCPKRVVEELFKKHGNKHSYDDVTDAPWILQRAGLDDLLAACPQRFAPFVKELKLLADGQPLPPQAA